MTFSLEAYVISLSTYFAHSVSLSLFLSLIGESFSGVPSCSSPSASSRLSLNSSVNTPQSYASIQLLGLEMLLHYFLGSQASASAAKNSLQLSLGKVLVHTYFVVLSSVSMIASDCF